MTEQLKRINKFLSEVGYCSRREADKLIDAGRVTINGVVPEMGTKITEILNFDKIFNKHVCQIFGTLTDFLGFPKFF